MVEIRKPHIKPVVTGATPQVDRLPSGKPSKGVDSVVIGEKPTAPKMPVAVRAGRFAGSATAARGKDPVDSILAKLEGKSDSEAAAILGQEFSESIKGAA